MRNGMFWMVPLGMVLVAGLVLADDESDRTTVVEIEQQLIDNLKKNDCWDAGTKRLSLRIEMARYPVCEKRYECVTP